MPPAHYRFNATAAAQKILQLFFWLPIFGFSLLLIYNTIPYFSFSQRFAFIEERAVLFLSTPYRWCFYLHLVAGMFCVASALLQFSKRLLKRAAWLHVASGRVYVMVVLVLGAPTGMYMSFFAKGSMAEKLLFMFMAVSWWTFTAKGLLAVLRKNILAHQYWMWRSYAMALTAVTFRVYYLLLHLMGVPLLANYEVSLWMSVVGNLLITEVLIYKNSKHYKLSFA